MRSKAGSMVSPLSLLVVFCLALLLPSDIWSQVLSLDSYSGRAFELESFELSIRIDGGLCLHSFRLHYKNPSAKSCRALFRHELPIEAASLSFGSSRGVVGAQRRLWGCFSADLPRIRGKEEFTVDLSYAFLVKRSAKGVRTFHRGLSAYLKRAPARLSIRWRPLKGRVCRWGGFWSDAKKRHEASMIVVEHESQALELSPDDCRLETISRTSSAS